jgi:hypothetical protein
MERNSSDAAVGITLGPDDFWVGEPAQGGSGRWCLGDPEGLVQGSSLGVCHFHGVVECLPQGNGKLAWQRHLGLVF